MRRPDWKLWLKDKKECGLWIKKYLDSKILRKSADQSRLHIKRTDHNLVFAGWLIEKHIDEIPAIFGKDNYYDWIINIYYYAVYHAATALMSRQGYLSKNHSATMCFLIYHNYHAEKALEKEDLELIASSLDKEDIETVGNTKELREKACYDIHESFEKNLAEQIREEAIEFTNKIKTLLTTS